MSSVIRFCENRQIELRKNVPITSQFNCDFLLEKFSCKKTDVYTFDENSDVPPFACKFKPGTGTLAIAMEDGHISLLNTETSSTRLSHTWKAHENAIFDVCWMPNQSALVSASGDHTAILWDAVRGDRLTTYVNNIGSVKCIDVCHRQGNLIATGSRDGTINVWDTRVNNNAVNKKPEIFIVEAHSHSNGDENRKPKNRLFSSYNSKLRSVTAVSFQDEHHLCSAGVGDGTIKVWDLRRTYIVKPKYNMKALPKHSMRYAGDGCTSLVFDSNCKRLFACSTNSVIYSYDCHSYDTTHLASYNGFRVSTYFVKLDVSPNDDYLVCGSSDETGYIWKVNNPGLPIYKLSGHTAEVTAVAWHPNDFGKLATCGDDGNTLLWRLSGQRDVLDSSDIIGTTENIIPEDLKLISSQSSSTSSENEKATCPSSLKMGTLKQFYDRTSSTNSEGTDFVLRVRCAKLDNASRPVLSPKSNEENQNVLNLTSNALSTNSSNWLQRSGSKSPSVTMAKTPLKRRTKSSPGDKKKLKKTCQRPERLITSYFQ